MARPKLGNSESKRLQMVITETELREIDTWQHANHIQSRSEAIRLLVQIGLLFDKNAGEVAADFSDLDEFFGAKSVAALENVAVETEEARQRFIKETFDLTIETQERLSYLRNRLNLVFQPYLAIRSGRSFEGIKFHMLSSKADALAKALQNKLDVFELKKKFGRLPKPEKNQE